MSSASSPGKRTKKNMQWTDKMDDLLFQFLLEATREGKNAQGGYTPKGWNQIVSKMIVSFRPTVMKDKVRNRWKTYKKWYGDVKEIMTLSGFGWDATKKMVTAEDQVWDEGIKKHPKWKNYRGKRLSFDYEILCELMGDSVADGRRGFAINDETHPPPPPLDNEMFDEVQSVEMNVDGIDERQSTARNTLPSNPTTPGGSSCGTKRKQTTVDLVGESVVRMADAMDSLATTQHLILNEGPTVIRMRKCVEGLDALVLDDDLHSRVMQLLTVEEHQSSFLALALERRLRWLQRMLE